MFRTSEYVTFILSESIYSFGSIFIGSFKVIYSYVKYSKIIHTPKYEKFIDLNMIFKRLIHYFILFFKYQEETKNKLTNAVLTQIINIEIVENMYKRASIFKMLKEHYCKRQTCKKCMKTGSC